MTAPAGDWTKGFDIERLRALAQIFKDVHGPCVYGAFGLVKERDIAAALSERRLLTWPSEAAPEATILWRTLRRGSVQTDFRGKSIVLPPGEAVTALAARNARAAERLLRTRMASTGLLSSGPCVEIFEEDDTAKEALTALGFSWLTTKVMAGSEVKGIYIPFGHTPATHELPKEEAATLEVLRESFVRDEWRKPIVAALEGMDAWAQHYSSYNKRKSWTALSLRGYSDDPFDIVKPAERDQAWKEANPQRLKDRPRWLPVRSPSAKKARAAIERIISEIPNAGIDRVRFMRLRATDGELTRHADITDREAGVADGKVARLHIPIITHEKCVFSGWSHRGERIDKHLPQDCLAYLDQRKPHAVVNRSPIDRVHLVIDVICNQGTRDMIGR